MKIDNLLIFLFNLICCCFCAWPGNSTWQNDLISGRVDRSRFLQEYKLLIFAFIGSVLRDDFDSELMRFKY